MTLRPPILVFPVQDFVTYAPLPGLFTYTTQDSSLPSPHMIACLQQAGGQLPVGWDETIHSYLKPTTFKSSKYTNASLSHALLMKPGSTVEDVYLVLKRMQALSGEFVRAEGCRNVQPLSSMTLQSQTTSLMQCHPKPIPKHQVVSTNIRILKIMTNKKTSWQSK